MVFVFFVNIKYMKKIILAIVVVIVMVGFLGISNKKNDKKETLKIGGLFALSGYASFAGEASRDGMIMAIEDSGMNIPYVIEDFKSDQKTVVSAAKKLLDIDKVSVVVGPEWAEFSEVTSPLAKQNKTTFISPWMNSETSWLDGKYFFSGTPSERGQHRAILDYMVDTNVKNIIIVYSNNSWSLSNIKTFRDEVLKNGNVKIVGEFKFNEDEKDYRTEITKINQLKPEGIYSILSSAESHGIFSKQIFDMGFKYQIYATDSRAEDQILKDRFGFYMIGQIYTKAKDSKRSEEFESKYEKRFGHKSGAITAKTSYDITTIILSAIKNGAKNSEDIRNYIANTKNYDGYSNSITFNSFGMVNGEEVSIKRITKDGYEEVK